MDFRRQRGRRWFKAKNAFPNAYHDARWWLSQGYKHGWEDKEDEWEDDEMEYRRRRDSRGRYV